MKEKPCQVAIMNASEIREDEFLLMAITDRYQESSTSNANDNFIWDIKGGIIREAKFYFG